MKSFIFDRNAQTALKELDTNKIPVYDTLADVDTTDLEVGQIVATKDDKLLIGSTKDVYSTEEVKTGQLWTNNKPIYRKVYAVSSGVTLYEEHWLDSSYGVPQSDIASWDKVIRGVYVGSNKKLFPVNFYYADSHIYTNVLCSNRQISSTSGEYIIIEYTKTSDTPVEVAGWAPAEIAKYVQDQNELDDDYTSLNASDFTNENVGIEMQYDGYIFIEAATATNVSIYLYPKGVKANKIIMTSDFNNDRKATFAVKKGDVWCTQTTATSDIKHLYGRFYSKRDYSGR